MDNIPNETEAAEVAATVDDLERGLAQIPLSKAINKIDDWKRKIEQTEREDLRPIAAGLGELHQSLVGEAINGARIGAILVRLGEQTEAAEVSEATTGDTTEDLERSLKRLGSLLRHAGGAIGGATADATTDETAEA
ncbi:hypothetical protein [Rubrivirga marina]|uniref:Uncharacterized protein n=1 Tax=Rubrivirga marina TaxID=1196024 RepID=A0A271J2H6_9BACT|nr:hypothetical protein [Rubrivirga marina]PAP77560.1 hypothetical protein BSZ37_14470 [Rubrivirga marina]